LFPAFYAAASVVSAQGHPLLLEEMSASLSEATASTPSPAIALPAIAWNFAIRVLKTMD
jgi:hypothetical protein